MKVFVFMFINSYASFYYIAFVAESVGDCPEYGCMHTLAINLAVVFGSCLASSYCLQLLLPYVMYQYNYYHVNRKKQTNNTTDNKIIRDSADVTTSAKITRPEQEYFLSTVSRTFLYLFIFL